MSSGATLIASSLLVVGEKLTPTASRLYRHLHNMSDFTDKENENLQKCFISEKSHKVELELMKDTHSSPSGRSPRVLSPNIKMWQDIESVLQEEGQVANPPESLRYWPPVYYGPSTSHATPLVDNSESETPTPPPPTPGPSHHGGWRYGPGPSGAGPSGAGPNYGNI